MVMLWAQASTEAESPDPEPCARAMLVDGRLLCDDELPLDIDALCPGPGPVAATAPAPGDAFDTVQLCAHSQVVPYEAAHGWSRMEPDDLAALDQPVDVNRASERELVSLPRIGPALARRIVEARPFADLADLTRVRGIGPVTIERLRSRALVGPRSL